MTTTKTKTWLSKRAVTRLLNIGPKKLAELTAAGHIRFRQVPGAWVQYNAEDVYRLAQPTTTSLTPNDDAPVKTQTFYAMERF